MISLKELLLKVVNQLAFCLTVISLVAFVGCSTYDAVEIGWREIEKRFGASPLFTVGSNGIAYLAGISSDEESSDFLEIWDGKKWQELPSPLGTFPLSSAIVVLKNGTLIAAWEDGGLNVQAWNEHLWEPVGDTPERTQHFTTGVMRRLDLFTAPDGMLYVVWESLRKENSQWEIYLLRWNGQIWEEIDGSASGGGISLTEGDSGMPTVTVAVDNTIYVSWIEVPERGKDYSEIYIKQWRGNGWEEVGSASAHNGGLSQTNRLSRYPKMAIASDNSLYIAWTNEGDGEREIVVQRWDGHRWENIGQGKVDHSYSLNPPQIVLDSKDTPYIAWSSDSSDNYEIYVQRWNGVQWEDVGAGSGSGGGISQTEGGSIRPILAIIPDDLLCVAWEERTYYTERRLVSLSWQRFWPRLVWHEEEKLNEEIIVRCFVE